jgi:hypothetical protein
VPDVCPDRKKQRRAGTVQAQIYCLRDQGVHHSPSILSTKRQRSILMFANQVIWGTLANIGLLVMPQ